MSDATAPGSGVVRAARRPHGWRAPGPPPAAPADRDEVWPRTGEELCYLTGDWRILQRIDGHRWSLDDLATAWFAAGLGDAHPPSRIADLGCGIGAVLLMLAWRFPAARCEGIEAQIESAAMARRSAEWNGAGGRVVVHVGDLRQPVLPEAAFELVSGTPPYLSLGTGRLPERRQQAGCHFEARGGIEAYCEAAARLMAPEGRFAVCHAAAQRGRVERAAAAAGLSIVSRMEVVPRAGKAALFTLYGMRHMAKVGGADVREPLVVRGSDGQWTAAFYAVRSTMGMPNGRVDS